MILISVVQLGGEGGFIPELLTNPGDSILFDTKADDL
jgi:hypothetical protein